MREKLYDADYVRRLTDLPLLVRMDTLKLLARGGGLRRPPARAQEPDAGSGEGRARPPPPGIHNATCSSRRSCASEWGDFVWWDARASRRSRSPATRWASTPTVQRPAARGRGRGDAARTARRCAAGRSSIWCRSTSHTSIPKTTEEITWAPAAAVESLARDIAKEPGTTLFAIGMGPNQFFNNDNKDRDTFLLAALTGNVGKHRRQHRLLRRQLPRRAVQRRAAVHQREPVRHRARSARSRRGPKQYWRAESAHYYNHEDHPLQVGNTMLTGKTHMPTPDQVDVVRQRELDPRQRQVALQHRGQRAAEDRDDRGQRVVVVARRASGPTSSSRVDSWAELKHPDMTRVGDEPVPRGLPAHAA